ncbi:hypothetical protein OROHE_016516 [Orobanche hederae]
MGTIPACIFILGSIANNFHPTVNIHADMSSLSKSESRRSYSWWWDSHISPKNSKWLQENLTDMDSKVKSMIKLIEEDADSFARRAEMFYKKRPELMKLVEEFYRAYRALAERYNHATGELRHAHRTIARAFPDDQVPFDLVEDSPSKPPAAHDRDPQTPEIKFPVRALFEQDDDLLDNTQGLSELIEKGCLRKLHEMSNENQSLKEKASWEGERAGKSECEVRDLKKALFDMKVEKEDVLHKYQGYLAKLSSVEEELINTQQDSMRLVEKVGRAETEVQTLKEALIELEVEKNAGLVKHKEYLEKISHLEAVVYRLQDNTRGLDMKAMEAESEARDLRDEISKLELEKEEVFNQYKECLEKISILETNVSVSENEVMLLKKKAEIAESEVFELEMALADLKKEKEASAIQYKCCLEKISELEREILGAKKDVKRLNISVLIKNLKLKTAEEKCTFFETSNLSLRTEVGNLAEKIATKDRELLEKQMELENLTTRLDDENFRHVQIEATLQTLQNLHSQSQDDQRALTVELKDVVRLLKDSEENKHFLEEEIQQVRDENRSLSETNVSSAVSMESMQNEILVLREIKERLQKEVSDHVDLSDSLQKEIMSLKEEIKGLNKSYEAIVKQVEAAGLSPKCFGSSIKSLQDDNSKLREIYEKGANENEVLSKKLDNVQGLLKEKVFSEKSALDMKIELERSREEASAWLESHRFVEREKASLVMEKASLLSQLETITETMHKLLKKNAVLENSLSTAKVELEGLREKSKGLEEICELLKNERSFLLTERGNLASKLENVKKRLKSMEKRYMWLEKKYADLEKEKNSAHYQFEELEVSLSVEKQERMSSQLQSETKFAGLESKIHSLQEENSRKKKEFEEELGKSLEAQFELSILQKFIKEMEEKNYSLVVECQKHVEASKLAEKLISELESESLDQQVESEFLVDEIDRLRLIVYQIYKALEPDSDCEDKIENERTVMHHILGNIQDLKCSLSKNENDKQLLLVENSVLLTLLEQLESKGAEIESQKVFLENELETMCEELEMVKNEKDKFLELNGKLRSDANESNQHVAILEAEMENLCRKQAGLRKDYDALKGAYLQVNKDNGNLIRKFCDLKEEKHLLDQHNEAVLMEYLVTANQSAILSDTVKEKIKELDLLLEDLRRQQEVNSGLERETSMLKEKMELQKAENLLLKDCVCKFDKEMQGMGEYNVRIKNEIVSVKECLHQTEGMLLDTEVKLEAAENLNLKLCGTVDELENDVQASMRIKENLEKNILELSENNSIQKMEIECLSKVRTNLASEIGQLREEIGEKLTKEQILSSKLQEKNNEFELWEAEASSFYSDLQVSSTNEILLKSKLRELAGFYRILKNENTSKTSLIEEMKGTICSVESEISGLKSQIYAYSPVVAALRDDITLLEHNALVQAKLKSSRDHESEFPEVGAGPLKSTSETLRDDHSLVSLQNLHTRIKSLGKLMEEKTNKPALLRRSSSKKYKQEDGVEHSKPVRCLGRDKHGTPKIQKIKTKTPSESRTVLTLMKDIPLDRISTSNNLSPKRLRKRANSRADGQMLELLWDNRRELTIGESLRMSYKMTEKDIVYDPFENAKRQAEPPSTDSDMEKELRVDKLEFLQRRNAESERRILDRLAADSVRLETLQATVQILRGNLEANIKSGKSKNADFETVWEQLLEAEDTVEYLADLNGQLVRNIESCPSPDRKASPKLKEAVRIRRRKVSEQAKKGSERIGRLQLELRKIQYVLMKMEEEKKNKGKNMFFTSKSVVLRDFIYNGRKNSGKRKKGPLCGCFRPLDGRNGCS